MIFFLRLFIIFAGGSFLINVNHHAGISVLAKVVIVICGLICLAIWVDLLARSRPGLRVEGDGVVVQGAYRKQQLNRSEVGQFDLLSAFCGPSLRIDLAVAANCGPSGSGRRRQTKKTLAKRGWPS